METCLNARDSCSRFSVKVAWKIIDDQKKRFSLSFVLWQRRMEADKRVEFSMEEKFTNLGSFTTQICHFNLGSSWFIASNKWSKAT